MADIERELVRKSFSSHAQQYDSLALVQKRVTDRFTELLKSTPVSPASLLDIGSGTGRLLATINQMLPKTDLVGIDLAFGMTKSAGNRLSRAAFVCGDAETLPFSDSCFDLVVSTSTYQWITPLEPAFAEVYRVLRSKTSFSFALFGEKTLFELRESYKNAASSAERPAADRTHRFSTAMDVITALTAAGFTECRVKDEIETEIHPDVPALLRSLKGIGAGSAARSSGGGLSGRSVMLRMMKIYEEKYGTTGGVQATYQVLYGSGRKE